MVAESRLGTGGAVQIAPAHWLHSVWLVWPTPTPSVAL